MFRLAKRLVTTALMGAAVVALAAPAMEAYGIESLDMGSAAASVDAEQVKSTVGALMGAFEGVAIDDGGLLIRATSGQEFRVDVDFQELLGSVARPSGNAAADTVKYGALGGILLRLLVGFGRVRRLFGRH